MPFEGYRVCLGVDTSPLLFPNTILILNPFPKILASIVSYENALRRGHELLIYMQFKFQRFFLFFKKKPMYCLGWLDISGVLLYSRCVEITKGNLQESFGSRPLLPELPGGCACPVAGGLWWRERQERRGLPLCEEKGHSHSGLRSPRLRTTCV